MKQLRFGPPLLLAAIVCGTLLLGFRLEGPETGEEFNEPPDLPGEAARFYVQRHSGDPNGFIPTEYVLSERRKVLKTGAMSKSTSVNWSELGPDNIGGRTRGLLIDSASSATLYAASVGGGG